MLGGVLAAPLLGRLRPHPAGQFAVGVASAAGLGVVVYCLGFMGLGALLGALPWVVVVGGVLLSIWLYRRSAFAKYLQIVVAIIMFFSLLLLVASYWADARNTPIHETIIGASLFLVGFGLLAPVLWGVHFGYMVSAACKTAPGWCIVGLAVGIGLQAGVLVWASAGFTHANQTLAPFAQDTTAAHWPPPPPPDYFTERIVGLHWRYHTEICLYDGWRPPLHDPFVVLFGPKNDPLRAWDIPQRVALYRHLFSGLPIRPTCGCALHGGVWPYHGVPYLEDPRLE